jgi:hypothetical protein
MIGSGVLCPIAVMAGESVTAGVEEITNSSSTGRAITMNRMALAIFFI